MEAYRQLGVKNACACVCLCDIPASNIVETIKEYEKEQTQELRQPSWKIGKDNKMENVISGISRNGILT